MSLSKDILKSIFPRVFLKRAFLVYNQLKANTWDKIFFKQEVIPDNDFIIREQKNPFLEAQINISHFDKTIQNKFTLWTNPKWTQDEYLLHYRKDGFVEPKTGWGVSLNKKLIYPSLGFASAPHVHKPDVAEMYFKKRKVTHVEKIISLRDTGEENYFHFFNDVLAKIFFLQEHGLNLKEYALVISTKLHTKHYFQYLVTHTFLSSLTWHVQQAAEWIQFDEAVFCKPYTHTKKYLDKAVELVKPKTIADGNRRVFLTRSAASLRFIENHAEIESVLKKFDFEIVDTSQLSFEEQIQLFSQCRYLVAIHGAGISNIMFRSGKPLSLLEIIQPSAYIPFHYSMLCKLYSYQYDVMLGMKGKSAGSGGFRIIAEQLEIKLYNLLNTVQ